MNEEPKPGKRWTAKRDKGVVDELLIRRIAGMHVAGATMVQIAKELDVGVTTVRRVRDTPECQALIKEVGEAALSSAKASIRQGTAKITDLLMRTITAHLEYSLKHPEEGKTDIIKVSLKVLGFNDQEQVTTGNTAITVVMPGAEQPKTFEVMNEDN